MADWGRWRKAVAKLSLPPPSCTARSEGGAHYRGGSSVAFYMMQLHRHTGVQYGPLLANGTGRDHAVEHRSAPAAPGIEELRREVACAVTGKSSERPASTVDGSTRAARPPGRFGVATRKTRQANGIRLRTPSSPYCRLDLAPPLADRFIVGVAPIDCGPVLLLMPFGFHLTVDTLPSEDLPNGGFRSPLAVSGFRLRARVGFTIPPALSPASEALPPLSDTAPLIRAPEGLEPS